MTKAQLIQILRAVKFDHPHTLKCERFEDPECIRCSITDALEAYEAAEGFQACEFCKGSGTAPVKKAWSPKSVLGED